VDGAAAIGGEVAFDASGDDLVADIQAVSADLEGRLHERDARPATPFFVPRNRCKSRTVLKFL